MLKRFLYGTGVAIALAVGVIVGSITLGGAFAQTSSSTTQMQQAGTVLAQVADKDKGDEDKAGTPGQIDDGAELLGQASISLEEAISAAQGAAQGELGEVDLEKYGGKLVFNVDVGDKDVKVDASDGTILAQVADEEKGHE